MTVSPKALAAYEEWTAREQVERSTMVVSAFGIEWEFPAAMPARLWLWAQTRGDGPLFDRLTRSDADDLAVMCVPDDTLDDWLTLPGLSRDDYHDAVIRVVIAYLFPKAEPRPEKEAGTEGSTSPTSSSNTSDSSTPTSPANTPPDTPEDSGTDSTPD